MVTTTLSGLVNRSDAEFEVQTMLWPLTPRLRNSYLIQWTTRITETGITNLTRITNKMATSRDYLMKYFSGILAVLLE